MEVGLIPFEEFFDGDDEQEDILTKIQDFESLCEYEEFADYFFLDDEIEKNDLEDDEYPF